MTRNDPCWCGSGKKWKKCHYPDLGPRADGELATLYLKKYGILLKTPAQIAGIRRACKVTAEILDKTCEMAKAGVTTNALNAYAHKLHIEAGATPAPLGYGSPPFPKSICTSLNDVICHGIPDDIPLKEGDILNIDVSILLDGYYGDCSKMVAIGKVDPEKKHVMEVSHECLRRAIEILKPGVMVYEIGEAIEGYATKMGCSVVNQFVGHGVGIQFHEQPQIPHHYNTLKIPLAPGMTFTIEPMINAGVRSGHIDPKNHWTAYTDDGKPSAQWEHTLLITETGYEILTPWQE
ncbi:MAG: methionyl aminopeptidase [Verrucomicrobia bacterium]|nr:methionyl aminopeptidase [Verrucomicrobiota bacterium]